jgi:acyl transferase domain-containing protein
MVMENAETIEHGVAVIGMSGRFPKAASVEQFWENLRDGVEGISFFTGEELEASGVEASALADPNYVRAHGSLEDVELFDAAFFGLTPREAEITDPQHRLFLECAWEAMERAGYDAEKYEGRVGVYGGTGISTYLLTNLMSNRELLRSVGGFQAMLGNDKDHLPTRVSYKLNLRGPSVLVQTACSTSLVAIHLACQSLLGGECDVALAGGVSVRSPQKAGYLYSEGSIASPDGHCRAFDAAAQGTVSGSGVGIVVLKRLADALADGDLIHAVIRGSAVNNDGAVKVGYTAPSEGGQAEVISEAMALADVDPDTVTYVEAHGSGTSLGDPIEFAALARAFRATTDRKNFCAIGSVKTNVGHLDAAAGAAGLIKTVLALKHKALPPSLHFKSPNPKMDIENSPFFVNARLRAWEPGGTPRRAGVSSFGMGGTNAHVVLEEAPETGPSGESRPVQLLLISAKTEAALDAATANLADFLAREQNANLADVAYTLQTGRRDFAHRRMVVCRDRQDAAAALGSKDSARVYGSVRESGGRAVAFMFPGLGDQYVGMGRGLYERERVFREQFDRCADLLKGELGADLRDVLFPRETVAAEWPKVGVRPGGVAIDFRRMLGREETPTRVEAADPLASTRVAQPAVFAVEYALARLLMSWGVKPAAYIGYSIGELVAACLAGVFSLEDALRLVAGRARLIESLEPGAMLAVAMTEERVAPLLGERLSLAAVNSPTLCVVSGPAADIEELERRLCAESEVCRRMQTSQAFHSRMMEPARADLVALASSFEMRPPRTPFVSNVSGRWIKADEATDPNYWADHMCKPVRFAEGLAELLNEPERVLIEVGAGQTLGGLAMQHPDGKPTHVTVSTLRHRYDAQSDVEYLLRTAGKLWLAGVEPDWRGFYADERRRRVELPTYPFERRRYWVSPRRAEEAAGGAAARPAAGKRADMSEWFYVPAWKPSARAAKFDPAALRARQGTWLIFLDERGLGARLAARLEAEGQTVATVAAGRGFARGAAGAAFTIDPASAADYVALLAELASPDRRPEQILHLWGVSCAVPVLSVAEACERAQERGFYSLLFLAQALGDLAGGAPVNVTVVNDELHELTGSESIQPAKATVLGPCRVIPQEYACVTCRNVDVQFSAAWTCERLAEQLLAEALSTAPEPLVAYRGRRRWAQSFETVRLEPAVGIAPLREGGVYLIAGGTGGIGLELALHLARAARAKLVLTARTPMPERADWERWLAARGEADPVSRKIRKVRELEALGAEVLIAAADVADLDGIREVVAQARARFGRIDGVVHAAGVAEGGMIQLKQPENAARVLSAKLRGALVLEEAVGRERLDFFVLCSSMNSVLGGFGEVDYCAANAFLDAFAHYYSSRHDVPAVSINWDVWGEVGLAVNYAPPAGLANRLGERLKRGILNAEGAEAFDRILSTGLPQVIVSTQDLRAVIEQNNVAAAANGSAAAGATRATHTRPSVSAAYVAPEGELEQTVAAVWQELLGIEQVGANDNFFELGGHSLLGTLLLTRLRARFQVELPLRVIFEAPTVAELCVYVEDALLSELEEMAGETN